MAILNSEDSMLDNIKKYTLPTSIERKVWAPETPSTRIGNRRVSVGDSPHEIITTTSNPHHETLQRAKQYTGANFNADSHLSSRRVSASPNFINLDGPVIKPSKSKNSAAISHTTLFLLQTGSLNNSPEITNKVETSDLKNIKQDIEYALYSMPVSKDKEGLKNNFLYLSASNGLISETSIFKPLDSPELTEKLDKFGFKSKDGTPGVYFNDSYKGTIAVSERITEEGNTEWNLFFKGVDPKHLKETVGNAISNITQGYESKFTKAFSKAKQSLSVLSRNLSETRDINRNSETAVSEQYTESENIRPTTVTPIGKKTIDKYQIDNYNAVPNIVKCFIEAADEKDCKIVLTLAGHSMGGGLAQTGLATYPNRIHRTFTFQAMDTTSETVLETIKNNSEISSKLRDYHLSGDGITGGTILHSLGLASTSGTKALRDSKRMVEQAKQYPEIRRTVPKFYNNPLKSHTHFIEAVVEPIQENNSLIFPQKNKV